LRPRLRLRLPTLFGQWLYAAEIRSLTVAGQWRIYTALPEHRASDDFFDTRNTSKRNDSADDTAVLKSEDAHAPAENNICQG
jgi:hypothetical protein